MLFMNTFRKKALLLSWAVAGLIYAAGGTFLNPISDIILLLAFPLLFFLLLERVTKDD